MGLRIQTMNFSAATDGKPFFIDRDTVLTYIASRPTVIVSTDPSLTVSNTFTPSAYSVSESIIGIIPSSQLQIRVDFPCEKGRTLFVCSSVANNVQLMFTDPV